MTRVRLGLRWLLPSWRQPARIVVGAFAGAVLFGTVLLMLPAASESGDNAGFVSAVFTATSAVCVTGLIVVDTPGYWSSFGELVILGLIQVGGLGIMTLASLLGLLISRRLGMRMRRSAQTETKNLGLGDLKRVTVGVVLVSLVFELAVASMLTARFVTGYGYPLGRALYHGVFHAVSAFNNAGFALYSDSLSRFVTDPWVCLPVALAVLAGGLGFPVWLEIWRNRRGRRRWSLHTKITALTSAALLVIGTAGFNSLAVQEMESGTLFVNDILMFIGGGSAGTAGGIKVTTFALLAFVILAEARGQPTVHVLGRRLPAEVQRQALAVALLSIGVVVLGTLTLLAMGPFRVEQVLFEAISAFATVGLSTGITTDLPPAAHLVLAALMFIGRLGPITLASALALRTRTRRYERPEERPIVG